MGNGFKNFTLVQDCLVKIVFVLSVLPFFGRSSYAYSVHNAVNEPLIKKIVLAEQDVTGTVSDVKGNPLVGVSIKVKGSGTGTVTDVQGKFRIHIPDKSAILVFSYIGYEKQEVAVDNEKTLNITMQVSSTNLNKLVVIGYGQTSERKLTEAVSAVSGDQLQNQPYSTIGDALTGRAAGLMILPGLGGLGTQPSVSIRGEAHSPGGVAPLYVIDNRIVSQDEFMNILPQDVGNISVLKDAAATAVYGSRAAGGAILMKTKKGAPGKISVTYSTSVELSRPTVLQKRNNSYKYALIQNLAAENEGYGSYYAYSEEQLDTIKNHLDPLHYPDNNFEMMALKDFAFQYRHNISLTGGSQRTTYYLSLGYFNQGSQYVTNVNTLERFNYRGEVTTHFDKAGLSVTMDMDGYIQGIRAPSTDNATIWRTALQVSPLTIAYTKDGQYAPGGDNVMRYIDPASGYVKTKDKINNTRLNLKWEVPWIKGLDLSTWANYQTSDPFTKSWSTLAPAYDINTGQLVPQTPPSLSMTAYNNWQLIVENQINYHHNWRRHTLEVTAVRNQAQGYEQWFSASRKNFPSTAIEQLVAGSSDGENNTGDALESGRVGYVGRLRYNYSDKYLVEGNFRYDGSDHFAENKRWGFFPSLSAGWVISDEGFMSFLHKRNLIDFLKFRASYGVVGNDNVSPFAYVPSYTLATNAYVVGGNLVNGYNEGPLVSQYLTWYTQKALNYGLDFNTFHDRLIGSFDYYYYRTSGYLVSPKSSYTTPLGAALPVVKSDGVHRRAGFEFSLNYKGNLGALQYEIGGNLTHYQQLWEVNPTEDSVALYNPKARITRQTDYREVGYVSDGLYQTASDIINSPRPTWATSTLPGDIKYKDVNGDGIINSSDRVRMGHDPNPHLTYGITMRLKYKAWSLNTLFEGSGQRTTDAGTWHYSVAYQNVFVSANNYWTPDNPGGRWPRLSNVIRNGGNNVVANTDYFFMSTQYFRLKSLQLTYNFKSSLLSKQHFISDCLLYLSGTNVFTISKTMKYFDPEGTSNYRYYPIQQVFSAGMNIGF